MLNTVWKKIKKSPPKKKKKIKIKNVIMPTFSAAKFLVTRLKNAKFCSNNLIFTSQQVDFLLSGKLLK